MLTPKNARRLEALRSLRVTRLTAAVSAARDAVAAARQACDARDTEIHRLGGALAAARAWCSTRDADPVGLQRALVQGAALLGALDAARAEGRIAAERLHDAEAALGRLATALAAAERRRQALSDLFRTRARAAAQRLERRQDVHAAEAVVISRIVMGSP